MGSDETFLFDDPLLLDFCMKEMAVCFSILLVALPALFRKRADGWLDFRFLYIPKIQAYFYISWTLVFNDCMEWANIPRWGGYRLGWFGQKIHFPFLVWSNVPLVAIKRVG